MASNDAGTTVTSRRSLSAHGRTPLVLLFGFLVVSFGWMATHLEFQNQWDNDEGIIAMQGRAVLEGYRPYVDFWHDHPPGAPAALALAFRVAGVSVLVARGLCLLLGLVGALAVAAVSWRVGGETAGVAGAALLVLSPHFFWLTRSINHDIPFMALGVAGLALVWHWRDRGGHVTLFAAGILIGLGMSFKLSAALLAVPALLLVLDRARLHSEHNGPRTAAARVALVAMATLAVGVLLVACTWFLAAPPTAVIHGAFVQLGEARDAFPNRSGEYATWLVQENLLGENLGLVALAAFGLAWLVRRRRSDAVVLGVWFASTSVAIVKQQPMWPKHHFSLVLWPLAILAGCGVAGLVVLLRDRGRISWPWVAGTVCLLVWLATVPTTAAALQASATVRPFSGGIEGVRWLQENTAPGDEIISDNGLMPFRSGRRMRPSMIGFSTKRVQIGDVTDEDIISPSPDIVVGRSSAAEAGPAQAILLWNDHLTDFKEFMEWLPTHYVLAERVGDDREIWQRAGVDRMNELDGISFGQIARLEGHSVSVTTARPGDPVSIDLLWRALGQSGKPYSAFAHLVGENGVAVAQDDGWPGANTVEWRTGSLSVDSRSVTLPLDVPAGRYRFVVGLYDPETGERVPATMADGSQAPGDAVGLEPPIVIAPWRSLFHLAAHEGQDVFVQPGGHQIACEPVDAKLCPARIDVGAGEPFGQRSDIPPPVQVFRL